MLDKPTKNKTKKPLDRDVNRIGDSFIFPPRVMDDIHIKSELELPFKGLWNYDNLEPNEKKLIL